MIEEPNPRSSALMRVPIQLLADLRAAFAFLTILPVGYPVGRKPGYAFAWFPLVGLIIGVVLWLVARLPVGSTNLRAFLLLLTWAVLTGGLHLDGFGDACDALLATTTPERRLEILKDPRAGMWAVVGLILLLLGKWVFLAEVAPSLLLIPPLLGRWAMVWAAYTFPYARPTGLGSYFREGLSRQQVIVATLFTVVVIGVIAWLVDGLVLALLWLPFLTVGLFGRWAVPRLGGGLTGDIYGAVCEVTELLSLVMCVLVW